MGDELNIEEQHDWLDAKLRDEMPYIDDAGFTARVVHQLPARSYAPRYLRGAILLGATLIACVFAYLLTGRGELLANFAAYLMSMPFTTVCAIAGGCTLLVMSVGVLAALTREGNQRTLQDLARSIR